MVTRHFVPLAAFLVQADPRPAALHVDIFERIFSAAAPTRANV
jgi:hypothetical protein